MTLASKYKERQRLESDNEAMDGQAFLRCRLQLGKLRSQDNSVHHALSQARKMYRCV
jgi:hypothetical protein